MSTNPSRSSQPRSVAADSASRVGSPRDAGDAHDHARAEVVPGYTARFRRWLIGPPRDLHERGVFHKVSLIALLAWVGLGADGLSSSAYGPEEAFRALGEHRSVAVLLAALMMLTVLVISAGYSRIIRRFPHGGGGYVVASHLLGPRVGVISGCALIIDYVLTITISIAAASDAIFSLLPPEWAAWKIWSSAALILVMTVLNLRGVRESVTILAPIFAVFVISHVILITLGFALHIPESGRVFSETRAGLSQSASSLGLFGLAALLFHAFSLGGGTYTGIEAVSNGVPIMRHPQVQTATRTMIYMAASLAFTATGLLLCYLLWDIRPVEGKTMNAVLVERVVQGWPGGGAFVTITMLSAGALLVVAAQAGFTDGPRVLANMAMDSWMPRRFAALSERLTTQNGVLLMSIAALAALFYTHGDVRVIVVMYSINVFLTFSLSLGGMLLHTLKTRARPVTRAWITDLAIFAVGTGLSLTILAVTITDKFRQGGWITLGVTLTLVVLCLLIKRHYAGVSATVRSAFASLERPLPASAAAAATPDVDPAQPVAAILVTGYGGLGLHTFMNTFKALPGHFKGVVFLSVGVIDSGAFKGEDSVDALRDETRGHLDRYVAFARSQGIPATHRLAIGTDAVDKAETLCREVAREFPRVTFVAGQLVFQRETWWRRILHNQTALAIQRRLHWEGLHMIVLPARIKEGLLQQ